jgi:DNA-binding transcriptional LysR family regulator
MPAGDELRFFLAVCREGSYAGAARRLRVDETTVGRRIGRLEAALGTPLFGRTPDAISVTPVAESVRNSSEEMERSVRGRAAPQETGKRRLARQIETHCASLT